jgi:3-deoxy-D-manno-octulosonic-acid transferase
MQDLAPYISSIVLVPRDATSSFGSLFEIKAESDEIFISGASVGDVEIISAITADRLKASGSIVTSTTTTPNTITSNTSVSSTTTGGFIY